MKGEPHTKEEIVSSDITDLFSKYHIPDHVGRIPVTGTTSEGVAILDHLPFIRKGLSRKSSGLHLWLVRDLLSGRSLPLQGSCVRQAGELEVEATSGPS